MDDVRLHLEASNPSGLLLYDVADLLLERLLSTY